MKVIHNEKTGHLEFGIWNVRTLLHSKNLPIRRTALVTQELGKY